MNRLTELCPFCVAQWKCKYVIKERKIKDNNASLEVSCTLKMERTEVDKKIKFLFGTVLERNNKQRIKCRVTAFGPDTHPSCLHLTSIQQQIENQTAYVVTNAIVVSS